MLCFCFCWLLCQGGTYIGWSVPVEYLSQVDGYWQYPYRSLGLGVSFQYLTCEQISQLLEIGRLTENGNLRQVTVEPAKGMFADVRKDKSIESLSSIKLPSWVKALTVDDAGNLIAWNATLALVKSDKEHKKGFLFKTKCLDRGFAQGEMDLVQHKVDKLDMQD